MLGIQDGFIMNNRYTGVINTVRIVMIALETFKYIPVTVGK